MDDFNTFLSGSSCVEARQHPDPRKQQGVPVFREEVRSFSVGDRIQFTAPANKLKVSNRELGTIEHIGQDGQLSLKMDAGRRVELGSHKRLHLDYGYAMTSHSSQGQTADRVLIHVDTELSAKDLLSSRMAYVAISRGAYDAQTYTNNASTLGRELSRDISHSPAIQQESVAQKIEPKPAHANEIKTEIAHGLGLGLWCIRSTFPDSQSLAEAQPASRSRFARRPRGRRALTLAFCASAYPPSILECQFRFCSY